MAIRLFVAAALALGLLGALPSAARADAALEPGHAAYRTGAHAQAHALWLPLAEQGHPEAQLFLGFMYRQGIGVEADAREAARWYRKAAEHGVPQAQYQIGLMLELGIGVAADPWAAEDWYRAATSHGYCPSQLTAGGALGDR